MLETTLLTLKKGEISKAEMLGENSADNLMSKTVKRGMMSPHISMTPYWGDSVIATTSGHVTDQLTRKEETQSEKLR